MPLVEYSVEAGVATLTLNRPDALNALNRDLIKALGEAVERAAADGDARAVVITGAGRSFVAGADIGEMRGYGAAEAESFAELGSGVFARIESLPKATVAAVNGYALGGGCELAMSCDIRLAGEKARFGQPEVGLGVPPGFGGTQRLPRLVGVSRALEILLTGRVFGAEEALALGLVSAVHAQEELMGKAQALAAAVAAMPQVAVRQIKRCVRHGLQAGIETGLAFESQAFGLCFSTDDQKEAMAAFVEKRKPGPFKNK